MYISSPHSYKNIKGSKTEELKEKNNAKLCTLCKIEKKRYPQHGEPLSSQVLVVPTPHTVPSLHIIFVGGPFFVQTRYFQVFFCRNWRMQMMYNKCVTLYAPYIVTTIVYNKEHSKITKEIQKKISKTRHGQPMYVLWSSPRPRLRARPCRTKSSGPFRPHEICAYSCCPRALPG